MFGAIRADISRYRETMHRDPGPGDWMELVFTQGLWAVLVYRFGFWVRFVRVPVLSLALKTLYFFLNKAVELLTGIAISSDAVIGKGLYIGHFGGVFIHALSRVGERCTIGQGVAIGSRGLGRIGAPCIGNDVFIGSGAKVLGNIKVGNNCRIGANAVVIRDLPDNATAVGVPAVALLPRENVVEIADGVTTEHGL